MVITPGGKNNGCPGPDNKTRSRGDAEEGKRLVKNISGLDIGHEQNMGIAGNRIGDSLTAGGLHEQRIIKGKRAADQAAGEFRPGGSSDQFSRVKPSPAWPH